MITGCITHAFGQTDSTSNKIFSVAFVPQYMVIDAIRLDFEIGSTLHKNRVAISPYVYAGETNMYEDQAVTPPTAGSTNDYGKTRVDGVGIEGLGKWAIYQNPKSFTNVYVGYGAGYHHIRLKYHDYGLVPYTEDDLEYYEYGILENQKEIINRLDVIAVLGCKAYTASNIVFFDIFFGPVFKKSFIDTSALANSRIHDKMFQYGYNGVTFRTGISIGINLF